jgi:hypothetical protein
VSFVIHHGDDDVDDPACGPIIDAVAIKMLEPPQATGSKKQHFFPPSLFVCDYT